MRNVELLHRIHDRVLLRIPETSVDDSLPYECILRLRHLQIKNIRVASEGRPYQAMLALLLQRMPVTTTRMFTKFSALAVCLFECLLTGHFQIIVTSQMQNYEKFLSLPRLYA